MGYTHYWRIYKTATPEQAKSIVDAAQRVFNECENTGVDLANGNGEFASMWEAKDFAFQNIKER